MKRMTLSAITLLFALLALLPAARTASASYTFQTFDYPSKVKDTFATGINNNGEVTGYYSVSGLSDAHGFVRSAGGSKFTKFDHPSASITEAYGINDGGLVTGYYYDAEKKSHGFVRSADGSEFTPVDDPNAINGTMAMSTNNSGEAAGFYSLGPFSNHGFVRSADGSEFTPVDDPSAVSTMATAINNSGQVTGVYSDAGGIFNGFVRSADGTKFTPIDYPSAAGTFATGINSSGQVAGYYRDAAGSHGFVRSADGSEFTPIDYPTAFGSTIAWGINDKGLVTGYYLDAKGKSHGFIATPSAKTYSISGTVKNGNGSPFKGVTMTLAGTSSATMLTGSDGSYFFSGIPNGDYTVTPSMAGYVFKLSQANVMIVDKIITGENFSAMPAYSISGTVKAGGKPLSGVTVTSSGPAKSSVTTGSDGTYSFKSLPKGSYTVTLSMTGYSFAPSNIKIVLNKNVTGQDFTATALPRYSISGKVTASGKPLSGVAITLSGAASGSTKTGGDGSYSFTGLLKGSYTLTPSITGYTFNPTGRNVKITNRNVSSQDFMGTKK